MPKLGNDLDVPYEEGPPDQWADLTDLQLSGGLVVMGAVLPVQGDPKPVVLFKFARAEGGFYPPVALIMDDDQVGKLTALVSDAVSSARRAARKAKAKRN